jgi:predicted peroxiredoxin
MTTSQNKYLFTVTHFDGDPDRVATPLVLANNALAAGGDVLIWATLQGVMLAKEGASVGLIPKSFPPVAELLKAYKENGGRIGVCPPCAKTHGVTHGGERRVHGRCRGHRRGPGPADVYLLSLVAVHVRLAAPSAASRMLILAR